MLRKHFLRYISIEIYYKSVYGAFLKVSIRYEDSVGNNAKKIKLAELYTRVKNASFATNVTNSGSGTRISDKENGRM